MLPRCSFSSSSWSSRRCSCSPAPFRHAPLLPGRRVRQHRADVQALAYACYAGGYVAWTSRAAKTPSARTAAYNGIPSSLSRSVRWGCARFRPLTHRRLLQRPGRHLRGPGPATWPARNPILAPVPGIWRDYSMGCADRRRRPGARLQPLEMGLIVVAIGASATYNYNRGPWSFRYWPSSRPIAASATAVTGSHRRSPGDLRVLGFMFGDTGPLSGTHGGAINPAAAGLERPAPHSQTI